MFFSGYFPLAIEHGGKKHKVKNDNVFSVGVCNISNCRKYIDLRTVGTIKQTKNRDVDGKY